LTLYQNTNVIKYISLLLSLRRLVGWNWNFVSRNDTRNFTSRTKLQWKTDNA